MLAGRDLLGAAQTGTGKTAGFTLPMLQRLASGTSSSHSPARHPVRALILTPTRELAAQVHESVRTYGKHLALRASVIFGGVGIQPQIDALRRGVDIVVATPGRLLDHVQQKTLDLRHVEILVLDEADRMLDMGFIPDIRRILALLPAKRQNLLFSATFPDEIRKLAAGFMHEPVTVEVARRNTPAELVAQVVHPVDSARKRELLAHLVKSNDWRQVLVFTRTKHGANRLAQQLVRESINADAIHGNKSQGARTRALAQFKDGTVQVLVATDIAARGLDIDALPHVVNFDLPHVAEDYVHRIGRTGRAGASGEAVSLVGAEDRPLLAAIERLINRVIEQRVIEGFEPSRHAARAPAEPQARTRHAEPRRGEARRGEPRRGEPRRGEPRRGEPGRGEPRRGERSPQPAQGAGRPHRERRPDLRSYGPVDEVRAAQLREHRMRVAADGDAPMDEPGAMPPQQPAPRPAPRITRRPQRAALLGTPRREDA